MSCGSGNKGWKDRKGEKSCRGEVRTKKRCEFEDWFKDLVQLFASGRICVVYGCQFFLSVSAYDLGAGDFISPGTEKLAA
jgi:hypothetical protein